MPLRMLTRTRALELLQTCAVQRQQHLPSLPALTGNQAPRSNSWLDSRPPAWLAVELSHQHGREAKKSVLCGQPLSVLSIHVSQSPKLVPDTSVASELRFWQPQSLCPRRCLAWRRQIQTRFVFALPRSGLINPSTSCCAAVAVKSTICTYLVPAQSTGSVAQPRLEAAADKAPEPQKTLTQTARPGCPSFRRSSALVRLKTALHQKNFRDATLNSAPSTQLAISDSFLSKATELLNSVGHSAVCFLCTSLAADSECIEAETQRLPFACVQHPSELALLDKTSVRLLCLVASLPLCATTFFLARVVGFEPCFCLLIHATRPIAKALASKRR